MSEQLEPNTQLAIDIFRFLEPKGDLDTSVILSAVSMVLATVAVEAGMEEEKAVYAFRNSFRHAQRRLKKLMKAAQ